MKFANGLAELEQPRILGKVQKLAEGIRVNFRAVVIRYYFKSGLYFKEKGDLKASLSYFDKVIKHDPRNISALNNMGVCYSDLGDYKRAFYCFGRACIFNNDVDIITNALLSAVRAGKNCIADYYCNKLYYHGSLIDPDEYYNLALVMTQIKKYDRAVHFFDLSIQSGYNLAKALHGKGISLTKLRHYHRALDCVDMLFKGEATRWMAWELKGFILDQQGQYALAVDCYNKAYGFE